MEMKKILIVSRAFHPMNSPRSFRATELAKEIARQGHDVTVLTPRNNEFHNYFENEYDVRIKDLGEQRLKNIYLGDTRILRKVAQKINRILNILFEFPDIEWVYQVPKKLKNEQGYDLLISIAVPHPIHWGVARIWKKKRDIAKTWVADCGDPYMKNYDRLRRLFYFKYLEKDFSKKADYITVPHDKAKYGYYSEFHHKIKTIPQGFNFNEINCDNLYKPNKIPTFIYAGNIVPNSRDPRPFIEYLLNLNFEYRFILYTSKHHLIKPYIKQSKGKIDLRSYIPRDELIRELAKADFLLNINYDVDVQVPSKLIDYYMSGRPILSIRTNNFDKKVVQQFLSGDYSEQLIIKNPEQYRIENVAKQFINLLID
jgi:hypothetical protein